MVISHIRTTILFLLLAGFCPSEVNAKPLSRAAFTQAAAQIELTNEGFNPDWTINYNTNALAEDEVRALLGVPDDIVMSIDSRDVPNGDKDLCYGTNGHLTLPTLGAVRIDDRGKAEYVWGAIGKPPPREQFEELDLRAMLRVIHSAPDPRRAVAEWDAAAFIRVVNTLQPLGQEGALTALAEYDRITRRKESQ